MEEGREVDERVGREDGRGEEGVKGEEAEWEEEEGE